MITILTGDCRDILKTLPDQSINTCVTSPPYFGLRDYGHSGQMGLEPTPEEFVFELVSVLREVRRVLRDDGTLWLNLGDSYAGSGKGLAGCKPKDLIGIPWMVAFALRADGWYLRQDIIWHKPNPMPESVTDRCTKAHEYIFLLSKSERYYFDHEAIKEPLAEESISRAKRKQRLMDKFGVGTLGKQIVDGVDTTHSYAGLALGRNGKNRIRLRNWFTQ